MACIQISSLKHLALFERIPEALNEVPACLSGSSISKGASHTGEPEHRRSVEDPGSLILDHGRCQHIHKSNIIQAERRLQKMFLRVHEGAMAHRRSGRRSWRPRAWPWQLSARPRTARACLLWPSPAQQIASAMPCTCTSQLSLPVQQQKHRPMQCSAHAVCAQHAMTIC